MLDWTKERYCWVPVENLGTLRGASVGVQMLAIYLAKLMERRGPEAGTLLLGTDDPFRGLVRLCAVHLRERRAFQTLVDEALRWPGLAMDGRRLRLLDFNEWQHSREPLRRLYARESPTFARLNVFARMLAAHLVRTCDAHGVAFEGDPGAYAHHLAHVTTDRARWDVRTAWQKRIHQGLVDLTAEGFLVSDGKTSLKNFVSAQAPTRKAKPSKKQASDHTGLTRDPDATHTGPTRDPDATHTGPTRDSDATHTGPQDTSARNDSGREAPTLPSPTPPETTTSRAKQRKKETAQASQGELFGDPPRGTGPARASKPKVRASPHDLELDAKSPEARLRDLIVEHPLLGPIVTKPAEFARDLLATYGTRLDLHLEIRDAGIWMSGQVERKKPFVNGRNLLRNWMRRALERPAPVREARPLRAVSIGTAHPVATGPLPAAPASAFRESRAVGGSPFRR